MAYSRWSHSRWYTFWSTGPSTDLGFKLPSHKLKRSQVFEICDFNKYQVTYGDIEDYGIKTLIKRIKKHYSKSFEVYMPVSDKEGKQVGSESFTQLNPPSVQELNELAGYIREFVEDVDSYFEFGNFFYYEWWVPLRNKIKKYFKTKQYGKKIK